MKDEDYFLESSSDDDNDDDYNDGYEVDKPDENEEYDKTDGNYDDD